MQKLTDSLTEQRQGLVVSYFGNSVAVESVDGQVFQCHLRRNQALPLVGDQVVWERNEEAGTGSGMIVGIEPRFSLLGRGDPHGKMKPLAANVSQLLIVMAAFPLFSPYLVDRYLVAAELLKIQPIIVLNKKDLLEGENKQTTLTQLKIYSDINYSVVLNSIFEPLGLRQLARLLIGHTAVLLGPSGAGKSSIITSLGSKESIRTGEVSLKGIGKHTTTATRLYHLPQGGNLIDSPGVRDFNLWPLTYSEVLRGFPEFHAFLTACKFRDCLHVIEPGCVVQSAVSDGKISQSRYASYQALIQTVSKELKRPENKRK